MRDTEPLSQRSKQIRRDTIELARQNSGYHFGGSFSAVEILLALYDSVLKEEDKFILSKGHACFAWYVLLRERGFEPPLSGHPSIDVANGICCTTGSLGHGLPMAIGMAMAKKFKKEAGRIFVLLGDGECQEGTTWESLLTAPHHQLDNVIAIVDRNRIQGSGVVDEILPIGRIGQVADILGWNVAEIDGHALPEIETALAESVAGKPKLIIANTIKGKGVSYMEDMPNWHANFPNPEQMAQAFEELK